MGNASAFITTMSYILLLDVLVLAVGAALFIASGQSKYRRPALRFGCGAFVAVLLVGTVALTWDLKGSGQPTVKPPVTKQQVDTPAVPGAVQEA